MYLSLFTIIFRILPYSFVKVGGMGKGVGGITLTILNVLLKLHPDPDFPKCRPRKFYSASLDF